MAGVLRGVIGQTAQRRARLQCLYATNVRQITFKALIKLFFCATTLIFSPYTVKAYESLGTDCQIGLQSVNKQFLINVMTSIISQKFQGDSVKGSVESAVNFLNQYTMSDPTGYVGMGLARGARCFLSSYGSTNYDQNACIQRKLYFEAQAKIQSERLIPNIIERCLANGSSSFWNTVQIVLNSEGY